MARRDRLGGLDPFDFNNKAQVRRFEIADWDGDQQTIEFHVVVVFFLFAVLLFVLWAAQGNRCASSNTPSKLLATSRQALAAQVIRGWTCCFALW